MVGVAGFADVDIGQAKRFEIRLALMELRGMACGPIYQLCFI